VHRSPRFPHSGAVVRNNIILEPADDGNEDYHVSVCSTATLPYVALDHNLHWQNVHFVLSGQQGANYYSVASLQSLTPFGDNSFETDPMLIDPAGLDFHPPAVSFLLASGSDDPAFDAFNAAFPIALFGSIRRDFDGVAFGTTNAGIGALR
jgi:hypothetical protein